MTRTTPRSSSRRRTAEQSRRLVALAVVVGLALTAWLAAPKPAPGALDRDDVIERAQSWTEIGVPYSQLDYRHGYRTDCSGFVSMAWNLPENLTTWRIPLVAERIDKDELAPGDVLLDHTSDNRHVVIFERWANASRTRYIGLECTGQQQVMGSLRRELPYPYRINAKHYKPWRYVSMDRYWEETPQSSWQPVDGYRGPIAAPVLTQ